MTIKVDKGIPIPKPRQGTGSGYPWDDMKVGDSFFIPNDAENMNNVAHQNKLSSAARSRRMNHPNEKYTVRAVKGGTRVWRIS